jgi:hypothetical protein
MLSKWWKTASAQRAFERARERKRESLERFLKARAEKQARLQREVDNWEVK